MVLLFESEQWSPEQFDRGTIMFNWKCVHV